MNLIRFTVADSPNLVSASSFEIRLSRSPCCEAKRKSCPTCDSQSYLPISRERAAAKGLLAWRTHLGELGDGERFPLNAVRLLEPVEVVALFDFA